MDYSSGIKKPGLQSAHRQTASTHKLRLPTSRISSEKGMREVLDLLQTILDNIPQAIFWKDQKSVYLGCNQNFAIDAGVGSPENIFGKTDGDLVWTREQAELFRKIDHQIIESRTPYHTIEQLTIIGNQTIWVETNKVLLYDTNGEISGILGTYRDVSMQRQEQEALRESQQMLQLIMDNIPQIIFWKDRDSIYRGCNRNFAMAAGVGSSPNIDGKSDFDLPWTRDEAVWYRKVDQRVMEKDVPELHIIETQFMADGKRAWVDTNKIPLHDVLGNVVGILGTYDDITERKQTLEALQKAHSELELRVKERTAELSTANIQLKLEINERKLVESIEREQRTLAEALRDTAELLNSTLNLNEVLDRILSVIGRVVPHDIANIILIENQSAHVVRYHSQTEQFSERSNLNRRFPLDELPNLNQMITTKRPLIINDVINTSGWVTRSNGDWVRSYMGCPIQIEGEVIGFINLNSAASNFFNPLHAERLQAFANQAAIAIKNARLYQQAQELAALEERQRLARDLHDAVSQTLWTLNLMADVFPSLWMENQESGQLVLKRFQRLTRGALAEMRTLLLELRPAYLVQTKLDDLIQQLIEAMMSRKKIDISFSVQGASYPLPSDVQVGIYRIAQEALNNISKHSRATQVLMDLVYTPEQVKLEIKDNGRGFEMTHLPPERMGMGIMRERAEAIRVNLEIKSVLDEGTQIVIIWPRQKSFEDQNAPTETN